MVGGDIVHVLDRYQLAVGHVEKVAASGDLAEQVPGGAVGTVVGDIAIGGAVVNWHTAVVSNGEDIEQLFQVGSMVLVVALDEDEQTAGHRQFAATVLVGQVCFQDFFEVHPLEEVIEDGQ